MVALRRIVTRPLGIRLQLSLWYTAIFLVILVIAGGVFLGAMKITLNARVDANLKAYSQHIAAGISQSNGTILIQDVNGTLPAVNPTLAISSQTDADIAVWVRVIDTNATPIYASPAFQHRLLPAASVSDPLAGNEWSESVRIEGITYVRFLSMPLIQQGHIYGVIQVGQSLGIVTTTLTISAIILALLAPFLLAFGAVGSYWLADRAFAPMRRLTKTAALIQANGDLRQRVPIPAAHDDLYTLAMTLNGMLDRLDGAFATQRRFIADASHDLRTPVAAILSLAENARDHVTTSNPTLALNDIADQAQRLRQLITNLLHLSRADEGRMVTELEPLRLDILVRDIQNSLLPLAEEHHVQLTLEQMDAVTIMGDIAQVILIVMNLIDNALTYTPTGGRVTLQVLNRSPQAAFIVRDTGIGIATADLPYIFDRFYRTDPARQRATGGSGLGLAIVRTLVEAHGGTVTATSVVGQGSTFTVTLAGSQE